MALDLAAGFAADSFGASSDFTFLGLTVPLAWLKLKPFYEQRLLVLRAQNDGNLTPEKTAKLRGRIAEINVLLSLGTDKPQVPDESSFE